MHTVELPVATTQGILLRRGCCSVGYGGHLFFEMRSNLLRPVIRAKDVARNHLAWLSLALFGAQSALSVEIDREGLPDTGLDTTDWVDGELPPIDDMWDLNDFQIAAKNTLAPRWYGK